MKWYERMNAWAEEKGWKLTELSQRSGITYDNIAKYSQGRVDKPRGDILEKIALALGRSEEELMFGAEERPIPKLDGRNLRVSTGGSVIVPAEMLAAMGVTEGDTLSAQVVDGELRLVAQSKVRRAQELVRRYVPEGVSLVDELIKERRAEAKREAGG